MQIYILVSVFLYVQTTVKNLHIRIEMSDKTVQTQIRLQSDQGLDCLPFNMQFLEPAQWSR